MLRRALILALFVPAFTFAVECDRLTASSNPEYPPYLWKVGTQPIELEGVLVSLMQRLSNAIGIEIDMVYAGPWLRTQDQANNGNLDIIAVFHTEDRAQWLDYLYPGIIKIETAIWVNKNNLFEFQQLYDLKNRAGLAVMGNSLGQESDLYVDNNLTLAEVSSVQQALQMLEEQRADYLVYTRDPGQAFAAQLDTTEVMALPKPISTELTFLAFSKKSKCNTHAVKEKLAAGLKLAQQENWVEELLIQAQQTWQQQQNVR